MIRGNSISNFHEKANHLDNVLVTYSDKKLSECFEDTIYRYVADVKSQTDYSAFGVLLEERQWYANADSGGYRFGFNNQEQDDDISGYGNSVSYRYRIEDTRLGRFLSVDPLASSYPWNSTYAFAENDVIRCVDLEGKERFDVIRYMQNGVLVRTHIRLVSAAPVRADGQFYSRYIHIQLDATGLETNRNTFPQDLRPLDNNTPWFIGFRNLQDLQQGTQLLNNFNADGNPSDNRTHAGETYYPNVQVAGTFRPNQALFTTGSTAAGIAQINALDNLLTANAGRGYTVQVNLPTTLAAGAAANTLLAARQAFISGNFTAANVASLQFNLTTGAPSLNTSYSFPNRTGMATTEIVTDFADLDAASIAATQY